MFSLLYRNAGSEAGGGGGGGSGGGGGGGRGYATVSPRVPNLLFFLRVSGPQPAFEKLVIFHQNSSP